MIESWHPLAQLVVVTLAVARVTVLVVDDAILDTPRGRLAARWVDHTYLTKLLTCHFCAGWWIALAWTIAWFAWPNTATVIATPFAVAMAAVWFGGSLLDREG